MRERRNRQRHGTSLHKPDNFVDALLLAVARDCSPLLDIDAAREFEPATAVQGPGYKPMNDEATAYQLHKRTDAWNSGSFDEGAGCREIPDLNG